MREFRNVLMTVCCASSLLLGQALANEPVGAPAPRAKPEANTEGKTASRNAGEPLADLRQKLAERLGSKLGPAGQLQVTTKVAPAEALAAKPAQAPLTAAQPKRGTTHTSEPHAGKETHWSYEGAGGPEHWGQLRADFSQCSNGKRQSPIDIRDGIAVDLEPIAFDYKPTGFSVIDNGHTVQVNVAPGNAIRILGRRYELLQFHFHRPSEERINGRQFDMVVHLVHKDSEGRLAVVAVLLDRGSTHPLIQTVWANLPLEKMELLPAQVQIDPSQLLPESRLYYTYMGSLTTPPCSEGVLWMVLKSPVQASTQQINIFSRLYPMNARPVQPLQGRLIKESN